MNYKITKIGLLNFWFFDEEEFNFCDGKLLLRGKNGSGKSVTMQSFIPLILDGDKRAVRLDPFGSKEKRIEDYILGPSDGEQKEDATSYLYMETYNEKLDKYITVGIGLRSKKGRGTDFWGFALKDGRKIKEDFLLYKDHVQKVPFTKNELKARIGVENEFVESQKDYKKMVNDLLFGFPEVEAYDEFINVLLQLRSPKLSKEYTPTKLMDTLTKVLQPLTDTDVRPLSEAIEDNDKTKEKISTLEKHIKLISNFLIAYQNYNEILLYNKANSVYEEKQTIKKINDSIISKQNELKKVTKRLEEIKVNIDALNQELIDKKAKLEVIDNDDLKKHTANLNEIETQLFNIENQIKSIKEKLEKFIDKERTVIKNIKEIEDKIYKTEKEMYDICDNMNSLSEDVKLSDLKAIIHDLVKNKEINFEYLESRINQYKTKLTQIKIKLEEKEKLELTLNEKQEEHNKLKKVISELEEDIQKENKKMSILKDEFKDSVNSLNKNNEIVKLDDSAREKIFELINDYNQVNYLTCLEIYQTIALDYQTLELETKNNIVTKIKVENENKKSLEQELEELNLRKELTFDADEESLETENILNNLNIPYIPFYKAIEFKDNITDEVKNKVEELLISSGIINSLLIPLKYKDKVKNLKGSFLIESTKKKKNLTTYFKPYNIDTLSTSEITNILESISIDENDDIYLNESEYKLDFLIGYPGKKYESKYIGFLKREEEYKKQVKLLESKVENSENIINNLNNLFENSRKKLELIKQEYALFPNNEELENIKNNINKLEVTLEIKLNDDKNLSNTILEISKNIETLIKQINDIKENIMIPLNLYSYKEALVKVESLISLSYELKNIYMSLNNLIDRKLSLDMSKEEVRDDIDYQNIELSTKNSDKTKLESSKQAILEILSNPEYQNILETLKEIEQRLNLIPNEINELSKEEGRLEGNKELFTLEINELSNSLINEKLKLELKEYILKREYELKYVYNDEEIDLNKILTDLSNRKNSDVNKALSNYLNSFNEYRHQLLEYRLNTKELFYSNETLLLEYKEKGMNESELISILNSGIRQDISAIYQGKSINIYELEEYLKDSIIESQNYISVQERRLFGDILLKAVGNKIRDRIDSSKAWVNKINEIMRNTQIDSNLSFQLEWQSRSSFTEGELDTKELVRLFKIDAGMLSPEDSSKLAKHFESKVKKELEEYKEEHISYQEVISKVLDYRNWFEFKLYYKRKGSDKKELTNKMFYVFSGGERAKSMYVPLFASTYAKLLSAESHALRVIALDEAFAGVDEGNIREMFSILEQLNLDYILTSQALWGDYDTVKELGICELLKDESLKTVAIRRYKWNGLVKEILE